MTARMSVALRHFRRQWPSSELTRSWGVSAYQQRQQCCVPVCRDCLVGLLVKASSSGMADPGLDFSLLRGDF